MWAPSKKTWADRFFTRGDEVVDYMHVGKNAALIVLNGIQDLLDKGHDPQIVMDSYIEQWGKVKASTGIDLLEYNQASWTTALTTLRCLKDRFKKGENPQLVVKAVMSNWESR